jgi:hypothetical protein
MGKRRRPKRGKQGDLTGAQPGLGAPVQPVPAETSKQIDVENLNRQPGPVSLGIENLLLQTRPMDKIDINLGPVPNVPPWLRELLILAEPRREPAPAHEDPRAAKAASPVPYELGSQYQRNLLPRDLCNHLIEFAQWAELNKKDARNDTIAFWALKLPAVFAAASAGVWAHFDVTGASVVAGAIASLCVIIDGIHPRGLLRNTHLKAYHDIRDLTAKAITEWRTRNRSSNDETVVRTIIQGIESQRRAIAAYIRDAETALNSKPNV